MLYLISPLKKLQDGLVTSYNYCSCVLYSTWLPQISHTNDITLTVIADLIAQLATSSKGLRYLLWGESGKKWQENK